MSMTHINLFSAVGGLPLGIESVNSDIETVLLYEPDQAALPVLNHFWNIPVASNIDDLTKGVLNNGKRKPLGVLSGRYRKPKDWGAWKSAISAGKPRYIIIEGLASLRSRGIVTLLQDLRSFGYDAEWHVIPACTVGAAYKGERLWIIAYPHSNGQQTGSKPEETQGVVGRQYITHNLLDEFRAWSDGCDGETKGAIFNQSRILRRDDWLSRRVDSARVRFLSDDVSPKIAAFIGFSMLRIEDGEFQPLPKRYLDVTDHIRNPDKKSNLALNRQWLDDNNIKYEKKNSGMHLVVPIGKEIIDYWPSTDTYIIRNTERRGHGVQEAVALCSATS